MGARLIRKDGYKWLLMTPLQLLQAQFRVREDLHGFVALCRCASLITPSRPPLRRSC